MIDGPIKYIDNFGLLDDEMFDLSTDPLELHNIIGDYSKTAAAKMQQQIRKRQAWVSEFYRLYRRN